MDMHWLAHLLGIDNVSGTYYGFWSGFGSDIGELAIIGGLGTLLRKHNCEVRGCWRLGRHKTAGDHNVCRRHHPDGHLTEQAVLDAHQAATAPAATPPRKTPPRRTRPQVTPENRGEQTSQTTTGRPE